MKKITSAILATAFLGISNIIIAQADSFNTVDSLDKSFLNWYNNDYQADNIYGASVEKTYTELLSNNKNNQTVVVAVIDGGVDTKHEDLQGKIWINEDEIANNGIDDDKNGYVDDLHGWNFIGNKNGEHVGYEVLEEVRIIRQFDSLFSKYNSEKEVSDDQKENYRTYKKCKNHVEKKLTNYKKTLQNIETLEENMAFCHKVVSEYLGKEDYTKEEVCAITSTSEKVMQIKSYLCEKLEQEFSQKELDKLKEYLTHKVEMNLNIAFNPRTIVGDDPTNIMDIDYGNADVKGPMAEHGTFVAGIIAANRNNKLGIDGIAENVKIMALRTVPNGDERDKDVALAIKYAVDNGAHIINMSFGKNYSPQKSFVNDAVLYAEKNNVLLIHAAGNSSEDMDKTERYPTKHINEKKTIESWINVGANAKEATEEFCGIFSNYGKDNVDLFAPGVNIISLHPENKYAMQNGTSFSCPVVSGVAALLLSYFPNLTALELKQIILNSATDLRKLKVYIPNPDREKKKKKKLKKLCKTGGLINAYEAFKLAEKTAKREASADIQ